MRTYVIVTASALLLAVAIIEIPGRIWPDSTLALLAVSVAALFLQGWLGTRIRATAPAATTEAASASAATAEAPAAEGQRDRGGRSHRADRFHRRR